ncbi:MAG: GAF domain-containing protein [Leptospira sp.]|nr:GAF domain-containing protein [Leptospira sp.]
MYDEKLVSFVPGSGWEWDFAGMQSKAVTENVVDLMAEKISRLSHPAQELLKLCSCIGNRFSLEQLVSVYRKSYEDTLDILSEAMMEGLIFFSELNRMAGKKALVSAAYEPAYHYLKSGIELLSGKESWISDYSLTYSLYVSCAEAAYLCLKYEEMEDLSAIVLANSRSIGDKIRIYEVKVKTLIAKYDLKGAVSTGLSILRELNVKFPKKPGAIHALLALIKVRVRMLFKADNLVDIPVIDDPETLAAIRIISSINSAAYWAEPQLLPLLILKVVNLSLKKGNTSYSPYNYAGLGLILSSLGFFRLADQVGKAGITLVEKLNAPDQMPRTHFVYNTFIRPWLSHLRTTLFPLSEAYTNSLHIGDIEFASHSALVYSYYSFLAGVDLEEAYKETEKYSDAASELKQETDLSVLSIYRQVILILTGRESFAGIIKGSVFDENKMLPVYLEKNDRTSLFHLYLNELTLNFFFGNFENAVAYGDKNRETEDGGVSVFALEVFYFYDSLARIAFMRENRISKRAKSKQYSLINKNLKKIRYCAKFAPMNYLHKAQLIEAEIAAASGNVKSAIFLYDKAIRGARENLFIQDEALSFDLAGNFYLNLNLRENARAYLSQARVCYNKWGASALLQRFDVVHSGILPRHERFDQRETIHSDSGNSQTFGSAGLDFSTILKFSHVLSSEIDLNILLDRILTMSMENAGAQKGLLILETKGKLFIEASGRSGSKIQVMESIPLEGSNQAPISIVNYVWKTTENLVLPDAGKTGMFTNDAYIIGNSVKSVICSPIIYKRRLSGILYLENNLTANAFNPERIELLSVLSSQAAISIDNARLISQRADSARFEKEMEITAGIQMSLIPSNPKSKGYEISAYMNPAESVGGDYYDLVNGNEKD